MTTTAKREPTAELRQAVEDAKRLLKTPRPDREEIRKALKYLLENHGGWVLALENTALLAPLARNRKAWDYVREGRGPRMLTYLGFNAYRRLLLDEPSEEESEAWFHLVEDSAQRGHIESRMLVAAKKAPKNLFLRKPIIAAYRVYLALLTVPMIARNPRDDRLPSKMRRSGTMFSEEKQ